MPEEEGVEIRVAWPDGQQAIPTNTFRVVRLQDSVELMAGRLPLGEVIDMLTGNRDDRTIEPTNVHALALSASAFEELFKKVTEIYRAMAEAGIYEMGGTDDDNGE